jgi:hypothetical protein
MFNFLQLNQAEHSLHSLIDLVPGAAGYLQTEGDVTMHSHIGKKGIGLEYHTSAAPISGQIGDITPFQDYAPSLWDLQAGYHAQSGGFPTSRRTKQGYKLAFLNGKVYVIDGNRPVKSLVEAD